MHYGRAALAATAQLPVLFVLPQHAVDIPATASALAAGLQTVEGQFGAGLFSSSSSQQGSSTAGSEPGKGRAVVLLLDQGLLHAAQAMLQAVQGQPSSKVSTAQCSITNIHTCISGPTLTLPKPKGTKGNFQMTKK